MKCKKCGTEYEGNFCSSCGARNDVGQAINSTPIQQVQQPVSPQGSYQSNMQQMQASVKKKKPFFLRPWFIILAIIVVVIIALLNIDNGEKIRWNDMVLGDVIPEPPAKKGEIQDNSVEELWIEIKGISGKQYADYIDKCKEKGFTIDMEYVDYSFEAYNGEGYKLEIDYYDDEEEMEITLEKPMEMSVITWPTSPAGLLLPVPKSTKGSFSYEYEDSFHVYIGETTKDDYNEYVIACSEKGFNVDYDKDEESYYADNSNGWSISLRYEGNNVMSINIESPSEDVVDEGETTTSPKPETTSQVPEPEPTTSTQASNENAQWRQFLKDYEAWVDDYIAIVQKYKANPTDITILSDYTDMMGKMTEWTTKTQNMQSDIGSAEEAAEYASELSRIAKKLAEAGL